MFYFSIIGFLTLKYAYCNHDVLLKTGKDVPSIDTNSKITFLSPVEPNEDITSIKGLSADRSSKFLSLILENNKDQWLNPSEDSQLPADDILFETKDLRKAKDRKIPPSLWNLSNNFGFGSEAVLNTPQSGFNYYDHQIVNHVEHALMTDDIYPNETMVLVGLKRNDTLSTKQTMMKIPNRYVDVETGESYKIPNTTIKTPKDMSEIKIDGFNTLEIKPKTLTKNSLPVEVGNKTKHIGSTFIISDPIPTKTVEKEVPKEGGNNQDVSERVISRVIYPAQLFPNLQNNETVNQRSNEKLKTSKVFQEVTKNETPLYNKTNHSNMQQLIKKNSNVTEPKAKTFESSIGEKQVEKPLTSKNILGIESFSTINDDILLSQRNESKKLINYEQEKLPKDTNTGKIEHDGLKTEDTGISNVKTTISPEKHFKTRGPLVDLSKVFIDHTNGSKAMINNHTKAISDNIERGPITTETPLQLSNNTTISDIIPKVSGAPLIPEKGKTIAKNSTDKANDIVDSTPKSEINEVPSQNLEHKMSYRTKQGLLAPKKLMLKSSEISINSGNLDSASSTKKTHQNNFISGQTAEGRRRSEALDVGYQKRMRNIRGNDRKDNEQPMFVEWLVKLRRQKQKRLKDGEKAKTWAIDKTFGIKSKPQPLPPTFIPQRFTPNTIPKYSPPLSQPCNETELETVQLAVKILTLLLRKVEKLSEPIRSNMQSSPRSFRRPLGTRRRYLLTPVDIVLPKNRKNFRKPVYPLTPQRDHFRRNSENFYTENSVTGDNHRRNPKYFPENSHTMAEKFHRTDRKYFSENTPLDQKNFVQHGNPKYFPNEQNSAGYPLETPTEGQGSYSLGKGQYPDNYAFQ